MQIPTHATRLGAAPLPSGAAPQGWVPGLGDRDVRAVLLIGLALLAFTWWRVEGYQIADSVEYIEHARQLVHGEGVPDKKQLRSLGFTTLLLPIVALTEGLGFEPAAVPLCRALQMALALALALSAMRIAAQLVSRSSALLAGLFLFASPAVLQWGVEPVSGLAAGLAMAKSIEELCRGQDARRCLRAGLWLGAGFLMAYNTLPIVVAIVGLTALRVRWRGRRAWGALLLGIALCVLAQSTIDVFYYGRFGLSIHTWLSENFFGPFVALPLYHTNPILLRLGFEDAADAARRWAEHIYDNFGSAKHIIDSPDESLRVDPARLRAESQVGWYFANLPSGLAWPAVALALLGLARGLRRPSWPFVLVVGVLTLDLLALTWKVSKSFRLWLPIAALLAVLCALGWEQAFAGARGARWRKPLGLALALAALGAAVHTLVRTNLRTHGGFWRAVEIVNAHARVARPEDAPRLRFASAFHWAVYMRQSDDVELVKLPWHLDYWDQYDAEQRAEDVAALETLDAFVAHLPLLTTHREVMAHVNRLFEVHAVIYDRTAFAGVGPLYVLVKRTGAPGAATFWDVETAAPEDYCAQNGLAYPTYAFQKPRADGTWQQLVLLGYSWRPLAAGSFGWITYHWTGGPFDGEDYTIVDRLAGPGAHVWENEHEPAYGMLPTSQWDPAQVVREGFAVVPEHRPFAEGEPLRPIGGDYLRGDRLPLALWMKVVGRDDSDPPLEVTRLVPYPLGSPLAVEQLAAPGQTWPTPRGHLIDAGLLARVGRLFVDVAPRYAVELNELAEPSGAP